MWYVHCPFLRVWKTEGIGKVRSLWHLPSYTFDSVFYLWFPLWISEVFLLLRCFSTLTTGFKVQAFHFFASYLLSVSLLATVLHLSCWRVHHGYLIFKGWDHFAGFSLKVTIAHAHARAHTHTHTHTHTHSLLIAEMPCKLLGIFFPCDVSFMQVLLSVELGSDIAMWQVD